MNHVCFHFYDQVVHLLDDLTHLNSNQLSTWHNWNYVFSSHTQNRQALEFVVVVQGDVTEMFMCWFEHENGVISLDDVRELDSKYVRLTDIYLLTVFPVYRNWNRLAALFPAKRAVEIAALLSKMPFAWTNTSTKRSLSTNRDHGSCDFNGDNAQLRKAFPPLLGYQICGRREPRFRGARNREGPPGITRTWTTSLKLENSFESFFKSPNLRLFESSLHMGHENFMILLE